MMLKKEIAPGITVSLVATGQNLITVRVEFKKGSEVKLHSHPHEQTSFISSGCLKYEVDGREIILREGEGLIIKPGVSHSCIAAEDTTDINTFYPVRNDYLAILKESTL